MNDETVTTEAPDVGANTDAQAAESVGIAAIGERKSGRRPPAYYKRTVAEIIDDAAPYAAIVLAENVEANIGGAGKKHPSLVAGLKETCMYLVNQAIGKPRQRVESVGIHLTYSDLAKAAALAMKGKKRPALADVFELSSMVTAGGDPPASELGDVDEPVVVTTPDAGL